jgi:radical SAM protein with 4Fe4S-binding SPASM domain
MKKNIIVKEISTYIESEQIEKLRNERVFAAMPREKEICTNCSLRPLCPYGGEEEE